MMDKFQAERIFTEEIGGRWPDLEFSRVLMADWIGLFLRFTPEDISNASKQYVLNHSQFKKPDLFKFKEILSSKSKFGESKKTIPEKWPQYFLQCNSNDCKYWDYGTFTSITIDSEDPKLSMKLLEQQRIEQEKLYGGKWIIITCYDESERRILINLRAEKNKTNFRTQKKGFGTITENIHKALKTSQIAPESTNSALSVQTYPTKK